MPKTIVSSPYFYRLPLPITGHASTKTTFPDASLIRSENEKVFANLNEEAEIAEQRRNNKDTGALFMAKKY